ncbi:MAG: amino acid-binding protein [Chloroflexota bacterium]
MQDLTVNLENKPGTLSQLGEALGNAGINIDGVCGIAGAAGAAGEVHILVQSAQMARTALDDAGISTGAERDVEVVSIVDQPGEMGRHLRKISDAGVNVDLVYLATSTRLVLGSSDMDGLRSALHST